MGPLIDEDQPIQAGFLDGAHIALRVRIQIRGARREAHGVHAGCRKRLTKRLTKQRVSIVEQVTLADQESIDRIGDLTTALDHPRAVGLGPYPRNLDAPRGQVEDEQDGVPFQARRGPHLHREEIRCGEDVPVGLQELLPRRPLLTLGSGLNPVLPEDGGDGPTANVVATLASAP